MLPIPIIRLISASLVGGVLAFIPRERFVELNRNNNVENLRNGTLKGTRKNIVEIILK